MRRLLHKSLLMAAFGFAFPLSCFAMSDSDMRVITSPAVYGELIKVERDILTVKIPTGRMRRLHLDRETRTTGNLEAGDYVQAWVSPSGRTESIITYKEMGQRLVP